MTGGIVVETEGGSFSVQLFMPWFFLGGGSDLMNTGGVDRFIMIEDNRSIPATATEADAQSPCSGPIILEEMVAYVTAASGSSTNCEIAFRVAGADVGDVLTITPAATGIIKANLNLVEVANDALINLRTNNGGDATQRAVVQSLVVKYRRAVV